MVTSANSFFSIALKNQNCEGITNEVFLVGVVNTSILCTSFNNKSPMEKGN